MDKVKYNAETWVVENAESKLLLLFVYEWSKTHELHIPIFRINRSEIDKTLIRYWLLRFIATSVSKKRNFTRITEPHLTDAVLEAIQEDTFMQINQSWVKPNLEIADVSYTVAEAFNDILEQENNLKPFYRVHLSVLQDENARSNAQAMTEIERLLWPVKIIDAEIQTWSIPINSTWAALWFDEELATQTLWGAKMERAFSREGIYYSGSRRISNAVPGRVLWYVTKQPSGISSIRACSRLDDIIVGPAKELFRQFRHLGIYEWQDLMSMIEGDLDREITAFRFSDTQLFNQPVTYKQWQTITQEFKAADPPIYGPTTMPKEVFAEVYNLGMKGNSD